MESSGQLKLISWFPKLAGSQYHQTSEVDAKYNCIAWAAGDKRRWWEPDEDGDCYWPVENRSYTVEAWSEALESRGYERCKSLSTEPEDGYLKVAIFADQDGPTHVARQKANGLWTSKLGPYEDIEHTIEAVIGEESEEYGEVVQVLKKGTD